LAQGIGAKARKFMKNKINYEDGPIGEVQIVTDFLPTPEDLVFKEETVKVTIALSKKSIDFFKEQARKNHVSYQKMIRRLLDEYAMHHAR
jgi:predicted DNA binding CopG/RHH family protein